VPQIFIHGRHVGGYEELSALDREGKLEAWLEAAPETLVPEALAPEALVSEALADANEP
jgi:hypothetical protein